MAAKPPHLGTRIYWWGILVLRLLFTHPLRWQGERNRWERDRERAMGPHPWE